MAWYVAAWTVAAVGYVAVREAVLHPYARNQFIAPVFLQQGWVPIRLTAIAALGDVTRLLLFPLKLRTDYSPAERTIVTTPLDVRFAIGAACLVAWGALFALAWRRGRKAEAFGLAWLALAFLPVANLLFPTGILVAERTLYLPSAGLALALGAWGRDLRGWRLGVPLAAVVIAGGIRSALRVPVWRNDRRVILSVLDDSPRSYAGPMGMGAVYLQTGDAEKALAAFRYASSVAPLEGRPYLLAGHAALKLRRFAVADSEFAQVDRMCNPCGGLYRTEAGAALQMGDTAVADSLLAHARRLTSPPARAGNRLNQR